MRLPAPSGAETLSDTQDGKRRADARGECRLKSRKAMAAELGLSLGAFDDWVADGTLPGPVAGKRKWDSKAVHAALDRKSGLEKESPQSDYDRWKAGQDADAA